METDASTQILEMFVTIGYLGADVKPEEMDKLHKFFKEVCKCVSLVAMERGEVENHLHFQMIVRAQIASVRSFGGLVQSYMGWTSKDIYLSRQSYM